MLQTLQDTDLQVKLEKSIFYIYKVDYLKYIISDKGIKMDPKKVCAIEEQPILRNVSKVLSFLGFTNFYYRFIKEYLRVALDLINLTKKDAKQVWDNKVNQAFQGLKK